jgi:sugar lactone lactonase YvrE
VPFALAHGVTRLILSLFLALPLFAQALDVRTLAGPTSGGGFADASGADARFSAPRAIAADASGTLYVADTGNHAIRKITAAGDVSTVAGVPGIAGHRDGPAGNALFRFPAGIALDATNGTLYVSDKDNHVIRRITPDGQVSTLAGTPGVAGSADAQGAAAKFAFPRGLELDGNGVLLVADAGNHVIRSVTQDGVATKFAGTWLTPGGANGPVNIARFNQPSDVAIDRTTGTVFVADSGTHRIRKIAGGEVTTLAGDDRGYFDAAGTSAEFDTPYGLDIDATGTLYVADHNNAVVRRVTSAGTVTTLAGTNSIGTRDGTGTSARFSTPSGIAIGSDGAVYVADTLSHAIRRIVPSSTVVTTLAGSKPELGYAEGTGTAARFRFPFGVASDNEGNIYVADDTTVRRITPAGVTSLVAGSPGVAGFVDGVGANARFGALTAIAYGPGGMLYVTDPSNNAVRRITPAGVVTTVAATPELTNPWGIAVDAAGTLYVTNLGTHSVATISPNGTVTTLAGGVRGFADGTGAQARFDLPSGITVDGAGNVYVADFGNNMIRKITPAGAVSILVPVSAGLVSPSGIVAESDGDLYVSDYNHMIYRVTSTGVVTAVAGSPSSPGNVNGTGSRARFAFPEQIDLTPNGDLVIADSYNHAIRIASPADPVRRRLVRP